VSLSLITLAGPLLHAATAVSGAVLYGAKGAFEELLKAGSDAPADSSQPSDDSIEGLTAQAETLLTRVENRSLALLRESGIAIEGPLVLESDALGQLHLSDGLPQAAAIERALAGDPQLADLVEELQAVHRKLSREREAEAADRLYALDPVAARKQLERSSSLDEPPLRITLRVSDRRA
jgi:hypothetical protein